MALRQSNFDLGTNTTTHGCNFATLPLTGSMILVHVSGWMSGGTNTIASITDNQGGTSSDYVVLCNQVTTSGSDDYRHYIAYRNNISAPSGTFTVTVTWNNTGNDYTTIMEVTEVPSSNPIDTSSVSTGSSSTPSITLSATGTANCLIWGAVTHNNGSPSITEDSTNLPILIREQTSNAVTEASNMSYRRVAATGTYTGNWAIGASTTWSACVAAIKQTGTARSSLVGMGAPAFTATSGAALSPAIPIGLIENDVLLLVGWRADTTTGTTPTSTGVTWANIAAMTGNVSTGQRVEVYWCRVPSGGVASVSFTFGSGTVVRGARVFAIGNAVTSGDPWDVNSRSANTTTDTTVEFSDVSSTAANEVCLAIACFDDDCTASTAVSGWYKAFLYEQATVNQAGADVSNSTLGNDLGLAIQVRDLGSAGSVGSGTMTLTAATNSISTGLLIAFQVAVSGTTFPVSLGGTLTAAAVIVQQPNLVRAGTLTTAGAVTKQTQKVLAGTLTTAGAATKQVGRSLAGTLTAAGALASSLLKLVGLSGTLTGAGSLVKQINKPLAGTLTAAGSLAKQIQKVLAGTLTSSGAVRKTVQKLPTGTLATAGALTAIKTMLVALAGTLSPTGAIAKQINKSLAGTLATVGALTKRIAKPLAATLSTAGSLNTTIPGGLPFRDDFTTIIDPGWDENDANARISVVDGRAYFEYDGTLDTWGDPSLVSGSFSRTEFGALAALVRFTNRMDLAKGFKVAISPSSTDPEAAGARAATVQYPDLHVTGGDESISLNRQRSTDHLLVIAKRAGGGFLTAVSAPVGAGGEWAEWPDATIIDTSNDESDATLYAHLAARRGRAHVDFAAILDDAALPTPLTTRFGAALASEASGTRTSPGGGAGVASLTDCGTPPHIIEAVLSTNTASGGRAVVCFRGSNSSYANCWKFKGEGDRVSLHDTTGVQTQTGAVSLASNTPTHLRVVDHGDLIECYVDGVRWLDWSSTTGATNTWAGTAADGGTSQAVAVTDFAAWDTVALTDDFGPVPDPADGTGVDRFTDAFTLTNGTTLSGQNGWTAAGSGTWQANSNQARMTAAATTGVLYRSAGVAGTDHQIEADITLPGTTATYPTDWYAGVMVRFTDINNFVQARFLYQDNSPEVEVWEYVSGTGNLIAYVNLGAGALTAGSVHNLRLAALGDEVAAYWNDELVAQGTTAVSTGSNVGIGVVDNLPHGQPSWDNVAVQSTTAVTVPVTPAGTLTAAGALLKQVQKVLAGATTPTGALRAQINKPLAGALTAAGALTTRLTRVAALSGTLTTAGTIVKQINKVLAGTSSPVGALAKQIQKLLAGTLTSSGAVGTNIQSGGNTLTVSLAATLTSAGSLQRQVAKALLATLATTGALVRRVAKVLSGTTTPTGALIKQGRRAFTGTASFSGALTTTKTRVVSVGGSLGASSGLVVAPQRNVPLGGGLGVGGDLTVSIILVPPPPPPEPGAAAETAPSEAILAAELSAPQFATIAESELPQFTAAAESGLPSATGVTKSRPPEFGLRG